MKPAKRSPISGKPLPQAGESLRDAAFDLVFDSFIPLLIGSIAFGIVGLIELTGRALHAPVTPWHWLAGAAGCGGIALWKWRRIGPQRHNLWQGILGEREVGRMLEATRAMGYDVGVPTNSTSRS